MLVVVKTYPVRKIQLQVTTVHKSRKFHFHRPFSDTLPQLANPNLLITSSTQKSSIRRKNPLWIKFITGNFSLKTWCEVSCPNTIVNNQHYELQKKSSIRFLFRRKNPCVQFTFTPKDTPRHTLRYQIAMLPSYHAYLFWDFSKNLLNKWFFM